VPVVLFVAASEDEKEQQRAAPRKDGRRRRPMSPKVSPRKRGAAPKEEFWVWHLPVEQKA
jgi:hypothetical protein